MTASNGRDRESQPVRAASTHLFKVGQSVRLKSGSGLRLQADGVYRITGTLPPQGASPQYRIRNESERHERVTTQDQLEPMSGSSGSEGRKLMERTFGRG